MCRNPGFDHQLHFLPPIAWSSTAFLSSFVSTNSWIDSFAMMGMVQKCATGEATTPPWCLKKSLPAYCSHSLLEGPVEINRGFSDEIKSSGAEKRSFLASQNHDLLRFLLAKSQLFQAQIPLICCIYQWLGLKWFSKNWKTQAFHSTISFNHFQPP